MFFCCLLLLFYLALGLIIRALSWSNFMMLKDFFHEKKYFSSWKEIFFFMKINSSFRENNSEITPFIFFISMLYTSWLCCLSVLNIIFTFPLFRLSYPITPSNLFNNSIKLSNHNYELWIMNSELIIVIIIMNCELWLMK